MNATLRRAALGVALALSLLGVVPGVAFAAQPSCGDTIMVSTTLTGDLDCSGYSGNGITFGKKGLTLNLNGYTIWGPDGDDDYYGVYTNAKKNVTVKNGSLDGWGYAVYVEYTVGGTFKKLDIDDDDEDEDYDEGIYVYGGANNLITKNRVDDVGYGIDVEYSGGNWITYNVVNDAYIAFYAYYEMGDHFSNNEASEYDDDGFYEEDSSGNVYTRNLADGDDGFGENGFHMDCGGYGWVMLKNNTAVENDDDGFDLDDCYDGYGYSSFQSSVISGNVANDNNDDGFDIYYSLQAKITNNTAKRNGDDGFYFDYPGGYTVTGNVANRNDEDGMDFDDMGYGNYGNPKVVSNNKTNFNGENGIYAEYGIGNATGNVAHDNGTSPDDCWNIACN